MYSEKSGWMVDNFHLKQYIENMLNISFPFTKPVTENNTIPANIILPLQI